MNENDFFPTPTRIASVQVRKRNSKEDGPHCIHVCTDVRASAEKRTEHRLGCTKCPVAGAPENPGGAQALRKNLKKTITEFRALRRPPYFR